MVWGNSLVHFLIWSPLISLQPRSFTASWSTWHGYLCSSEVERRGGWGGAELKVMQEAFRPLLWASTAGNSPGSLGAGLQLTEATRWKTTTYQEAPTWQMELERGQNSDCGNESISAFCFSSKSLPPLQAWAALAGLSTLTFSLGSIIMVVNGCQVCGCFVFFFFFWWGWWEIIYYQSEIFWAMRKFREPRDSFIGDNHYQNHPQSQVVRLAPPFSAGCSALWMFYSSPEQVPPVAWVLIIVCLTGQAIQWLKYSCEDF